MKILHSIFTHDDGGTERYVADLANAQLKSGHDVAVMIRGDRKGGSKKDAFLGWLDSGVSVLKLPANWVLRKWPTPPIKTHIKDYHPDIIHTHHGRDSRYLSKLSGGIPVVATVHMHYREKDYQHHDGLICVSPWLVKTIPEAMQTQTTLIPNWVRPYDYKAAKVPRRAALRKKLKLSDDTILFGSVGRLSPEKAPIDLVDAFILADIPNSHLVLFGQGELEEKVKALIAPRKEQITLMGYDADIRPWYKAFDVFVLPSRSESFGLVLLEAMDASCRIVTTRTDGAHDLLGENKEVLFADVAAPANLAIALKKVASKPRKRINYKEISRYRLTDAEPAIMKFYQRFLSQ